MNYQPVLGMNIMGYQNSIIKSTIDQAIDQIHSGGIIWKIKALLELVVRIFSSKQVKLIVTVKLISKFKQMLRIGKSS